MIFLPAIYYNSQLTQNEVEQRFYDSQMKFYLLKKKYTTGIRKYQFWLGKNDRKFLTDMSNNLLLFGTQESVQLDVATTVDIEETLWYKISYLSDQIIDMMASYVNTGTKRIYYSKPFWNKDFTIIKK